MAPDQAASSAAAEYEWSLAGGDSSLAKEAFMEWQYDVLEAWAGHADGHSIARLAEELVELVRSHPHVHAASCTRAMCDSRNPRGIMATVIP